MNNFSVMYENEIRCLQTDLNNLAKKIGFTKEDKSLVLDIIKKTEQDSYFSRSLLGKYVTTAYLIHYKDHDKEVWLYYITEISYFLYDLQKLVIKNKRFNKIDFITLFKIGVLFVKLIKKLLEKR